MSQKSVLLFILKWNLIATGMFSLIVVNLKHVSTLSVSPYSQTYPSFPSVKVIACRICYFKRRTKTKDRMRHDTCFSYTIVADFIGNLTQVTAFKGPLFNIFPLLGDGSCTLGSL